MWWARKCSEGHKPSPQQNHEEEKHPNPLLGESHELPSVSYHKLQFLLLQCDGAQHPSTLSPCSACSATFFPLLQQELVVASQYFDRRARWLSRIHLASGFRKCVHVVRFKEARHTSALILGGHSLLQYASIITLATRELLEKYDEVHVSSEGLAFRTWLMSRHLAILQSPWLVELLALYFNLKSDASKSCSGCVWDLEGGKPTLSFMPHESIKLEIEVTCSICLEIMFEPVALKCGHIFCLSCACSAASVLIIEGFKKAKKKAKCPLCRETGVFTSTTRLMELNLLISRSCEDYWKKRFQRERKERLQEAKEYWTLMSHY